MKQLTRKQLQNDLDAAEKRGQHLCAELDNLEKRVRAAECTLHVVLQERDDWRAAFKTISKLVK